MFYVCGFVPWHVRRLRSTGDLVPEVIPLGTFTWHTELRMEKEKRRRNDDASSRFHRAHASYVPAIVDERNDRRGRGHWGVEWHNPPPKRIKKKGEDEEDDEEEKDKDEEEKAGTKREVAASVRRGDQVQDNRGAGGTSGVHGLTSVEVGHPVGSRSVRMDGENKYVQYRLRINDGGLTEEASPIPPPIPSLHTALHHLTVRRRRCTSTTLCLPSSTSAPTP